jgi:hypothetical protein
VYSVTTNGQFHSININNGGPSVGILGGVAVSNALNSNGLGFSSINGKFYYFNHCANSDFIEFVSYDPVTKTKVVLASPPAPMTTADKIRTGAVTKDGTGYYTLMTTLPAAAATFYYYSIGSNTWKVIASAFKDTATAASLDSMFHNLNSGDMSFDGGGNLWIVCSKNPKYAVYKVQAPVTTNAVPKLAVTVMLPTHNMPCDTSGASFTGVAFNSAGKMYLTTGSNSSAAVGTMLGAGNHYNILYRMTSIIPLVIDSITRLPNSYGDDMTSCTYPAAVLGTSFDNFSASLQSSSIKLLWNVNENTEVDGYDVEYSVDGGHWQTTGHVSKQDNYSGLHTYNYTVNEYNQGQNYFRIVQLSVTGKKLISEVRLIDARSIGKISIGPNPAHDVIYLYNKDNSTKLLAKVFDSNGRLVYSTIVSPDQQSINVSHLSKGQFILNLSLPESGESVRGYHFIKW